MQERGKRFTGQEPCAYCPSIKSLRGKGDHVFPRALFKGLNRQSPVCVPACERCNNPMADDEATFRNFVLLCCTHPNDAAKAVWDAGAMKAFEAKDGPHRLLEVISHMKEIDVNGHPRSIIYPNASPAVLRVVRKIVRGLCYDRQLAPPIGDSRVFACIDDDTKYLHPSDYFNEENYFVPAENICAYGFRDVSMIDEEIHSVWMVNFFDVVSFVAVVRKN